MRSLAFVLAAVLAVLSIGPVRADPTVLNDTPYVVLNAQVNLAPATASVSAIDVAVNPVSTKGSSVVLNANTIAAVASGNEAVNRVVLPSEVVRNTPVAIGSLQINTAVVSAAVSNVNVGVNAGTVSNAAISISGNQIGATAIGNSVTNVIK